MTQDALATRLEISTKNLQRIEAGKQNLTLRTIERIAAALDHSPLFLLETETKTARSFAEEVAPLTNAGFNVRETTRSGRRRRGDVALVDLVAAAGLPRAERTVETRGWIDFERRIDGDRHFVARVEGDSMAPLVSEGAFALFRRVAAAPEVGRIYLFEAGSAADAEIGGAFLLKRLRSVERKDGVLVVTLESLNKKYGRLRIPVDDLRELRVVGELVEVVA